MKPRARARFASLGRLALGCCLPILPLAAQTVTDTTAVPSCPVALSVAAGRVCLAAFEGLTMMHPLGALLISGGNPVLGTAGPGAGGQFGHVRIAFRATRTAAVFPDLQYDGSGDTVKVKRRVRLYSRRFDLSAGILHKAMPTGTVGLDFLLSTLVIPKGSSVEFTPIAGSRSIGTTAVALDWGIRAGLISAKLPLLSLSVVKRSSPTVRIGDVTKDDLASYVFNATATNVRLFVGKNFKKVEFAAGAGVDLLGGKGVVFYKDPDTGELQSPIDVALSGMRLTTAVNLGAIVGPVRITGEGGYQAPSTLGLKTIFAENDTNAGKFFAAIGISVVY